MMYDARKIEALKSRYPAGTRIELVSMDDPLSIFRDKGSYLE